MPEWLKRLTKADIRNSLAILYVVAILGYIYVLVYHAVPAENKDLVNIIGGNVIAGLSLVLGYYFGSAKNDVKKDGE